ncbi:MAG: RNA-binding protein [Alphaproteobacteria bacterium]|nr:RNA-binding protein [Alphaproteobacteria bacterium]
MILATTEIPAAKAAGGGAKTADEKLRRCIAAGTSSPRHALLRFVLSPGGVLTPDAAGRLPGRGVWLTPSAAAIAQAVDRKLFARAFRGPVTVPDGLAALVERLLVQRLVDALGLARRAGQAVAGAAKVEQWFDDGNAGLLVLASDAGADARRRWSVRPARIEVLNGEEIGRAFARGRTAQAAVAEGPFCRRLIEDAGRLAGLRPEPPPAGGLPETWDSV